MSDKITLPRIMIAAPHSGAGKTTVAMGIASWLAQELSVAPFKVGPDYIDPGYLSAGAGVPAVNLDGWLMPRATLTEMFFDHCGLADIAIIEGVMGVFDGHGSSESGSSAEIAAWLKIPVILVVDASRTGRSVAALVRGFKDFDPCIDIAGVFLNKIGGASHLNIARAAVEDLAGVPVVGHLTRDDGFSSPSRHLGLVQLGADELKVLAARLGRSIGANCDRELLMNIAGAAGEVSVTRNALWPKARRAVKIGVARDEAFSFYYPDNLRLLEKLGAGIVYFSPIEDKALPAGIDGLFFGGGWPELHVKSLSANLAMRQSVGAAAAKGLPIYAECGGLIYLTESLSVDGQVWPLVGLLPATSRLTQKRQGLGYRQARFERRTILGDKDLAVRGHEFHWSTVERKSREDYDRAYTYSDGASEGFASDNILASYLHINWRGQPELAVNFINSCVEGAYG